MVKDGEDKHGLQTTNLKNSVLTFEDGSSVLSAKVFEKWAIKSKAREKYNIYTASGGIIDQSSAHHSYQAREEGRSCGEREIQRLWIPVS